MVVSSERNLLFVVANLAEVALIAAVWFRASGQAASPGSAGYLGFSLVTQLAIPDAPPWSKLAITFTEIAALVLLIGGVAILIGEVQEKIYAVGAWQTARGRPDTEAPKQDP